MTHLGIGSFAYRYGAGFPGCMPAQPMTVSQFLQASADMGFDTVQLCENLRYTTLDRQKHLECARQAKELGLRVELGMNGITTGKLLDHLELCRLYDSPFLRVVVGINCQEEEALAQLREVLPEFIRAGVTIGIENHFDLTTREIVRIVAALDSPFCGCVFDSTNSIGIIQQPMDTLEMFFPYMVSVHIKDYAINKVEAGYFMSGRTLGEGVLPIAAIYERLAKAERLQSVVMELTIRRQAGADAMQAAREERPLVEENARRFLALGKKYLSCVP